MKRRITLLKLPDQLINNKDKYVNLHRNSKAKRLSTLEISIEQICKDKKGTDSNDKIFIEIS